MDRTDPLTPLDCDLRGMPFMALDVVRLLDSDFFALTTGDEFKAGVALWCKSWNQLPAGSLPANDRVLAHLSGVGLAGWPAVKEMALHGWIECSDGRLYHPTVAEKALEAWERRGEWNDVQENKKSRQQRWRARCKALSQLLRDAGVTPPAGAKLETLESLCRHHGVDPDEALRDRIVDKETSTGGVSRDAQSSTGDVSVDAGEIGKTGTGTGTGIDNEDANASSVLAEPKTTRAPSRKSKTVGPEPFEAAWKAYPHVEGRSSKPNALAEWKKLGDDEQTGLLAAVQRFAPKVSQAHGDKGAPCMSRWLRDGKHLNWMAPAGAGPVLEFDGPPALLASVIRATSEDFAQKWVKPCHWREADRTLVARNSFSAKQLTTQLAAWLAKNDVRVEVAGDAGQEAA